MKRSVSVLPLFSTWLLFSCLLLVTKAHIGAADLERKHVILVVVDGSQLTHEIVASHFLEGESDGLVVHSFPYHGLATTWDLSTLGRRARAAGVDLQGDQQPNPIWGFDPAVDGQSVHPLIEHDLDVEARFLAAATDGAAAATALATGTKTINGRIAWGPSDQPNSRRTTLWERAQQQGRAIGVVSSVPFNHSTPAAFVAHSHTHTAYHALAHDILLNTRPDVVIGAGHPDPEQDGMSDHRYIDPVTWAEIQADPSIRLVQSGPQAGRRLIAEAINSANSGQQLVGVFGHNQDPRLAGDRLVPPRPFVREGELSWGVDSRDPLLADAAEAAIRRLAADPEGFCLMIEAGDVDVANSNDDLTGMIAGWAAADDAIGRVVRLVGSRTVPGVNAQNTLVIVTSGHGNGLMRIRDDYDLAAGVIPSAVQAPLGESFLQPWPAEADCVYPAMPDGTPLDRLTNELVTVYAWGGDLGLLVGFEGGLVSRHSLTGSRPYPRSYGSIPWSRTSANP